MSPTTAGASDAGCAPCLTIQGGVDKAAAAPGADEVQVAAGTFNEDVAIAAGDDVAVTGAGIGATTLDSGAVVALTMDHPAVVRRMTVHSTASRIVDLYGGTLSEAWVQPDAVTFPANTGVNMPSGGAGSPILRDSTVVLPLDTSTNYGVYVSSTTGEPQILRSSVTAGYAVNLNSTRPVSITHSTLSGHFYGARIDNLATSVAIAGSLVLPRTAGGSHGTGVFKRVGSNATATVTGSTIVRTGQTTGVSADGGFVAVVDSILWGHQADVDRSAVVDGNPTISLTRTLYNPNKVTLSGPGVFDTSGGGNLEGVAPGFVSELTSDFRLLATSPALDAGTPGAPPASASPPPPPPLAAPTTPQLSIRGLGRSVRGRILRLTISSATPGRLVLLARNSRGRVVGRRAIAKLRAGRTKVAFRLSSGARAGALVVSAALTGSGVPAAKDVQFTRLVGLPAARS